MQILSQGCVHCTAIESWKIWTFAVMEQTWCLINWRTTHFSLDHRLTVWGGWPHQLVKFYMKQYSTKTALKRSMMIMRFCRLHSHAGRSVTWTATDTSGYIKSSLSTLLTKIHKLTVDREFTYSFRVLSIATQCWRVFRDLLFQFRFDPGEHIFNLWKRASDQTRTFITNLYSTHQKFMPTAGRSTVL